MAPLKDGMLLGVGVLFDRRVRFTLNSGAMELGNETIMMTLHHSTPLTLMVGIMWKLGEFRLN